MIERTLNAKLIGDVSSILKYESSSIPPTPNKAARTDRKYGGLKKCGSPINLATSIKIGEKFLDKNVCPIILIAKKTSAYRSFHLGPKYCIDRNHKK